jgi:hypothetical protein
VSDQSSTSGDSGSYDQFVTWIEEARAYAPGGMIYVECEQNALPVLTSVESIRVIGRREWRRMRVIQRQRWSGILSERRLSYGRALHRARKKAGLDRYWRPALGIVR